MYVSIIFFRVVGIILYMWLRKPVLPVAVARAALVFLRPPANLRAYRAKAKHGALVLPPVLREPPPASPSARRGARPLLLQILLN